MRILTYGHQKIGQVKNIYLSNSEFIKMEFGWDYPYQATYGTELLLLYTK